MPVLAHLEPLDDGREERRGTPRLQLSLGSNLGPCGSSVAIHDLSRGGLLLETAADLAAGDMIEVQLPEMGASRAIVVWRDGLLFGCRFEHPIPRAAVSAALLRSEPPDSRHTLSPRLTDGESSGRYRIRLVAIAAFLSAGIVGLVLTENVAALATPAAVLAILLCLLVAWGAWVVDNTLNLKP